MKVYRSWRANTDTKVSTPSLVVLTYPGPAMPFERTTGQGPIALFEWLQSIQDFSVRAIGPLECHAEKWIVLVV